MPQLPVELRRRRAAQLREKAMSATERFLQRRIGRPASILIEQTGIGRDETYAPVVVPAFHEKGAIIAATIAAARDGKLWLEAA
jgi:threonylcarbamoyladenosine tRNA methylthiotransferase MtaB